MKSPAKKGGGLLVIIGAKPKKMSAAEDAKLDKQQGIKEGSKKDQKLDKARGIKDYGPKTKKGKY